MSEKDVLNVEEAAEFLGFNPCTIRDKARLGEIPGRKIGYQWRFSRRALLVFVEGMPSRFADMTMLKPDEVAFLEHNCGLSFPKAKQIAEEDEAVPFWSFLINDRPLTEADIQRAHELIAQHPEWEST